MPGRKSSPEPLQTKRIAAWTFTLIFHTALFGLLSARNDQSPPLLLGASESDALIVEFLPPALPVAPAPEPTVRESKPVRPMIDRSAAQPKPTAPARIHVEAVAETDAPIPPALPNAPVVQTDFVPAGRVSEPAAKPTPTAVEAPLTARGKRAQTQYLRELMAWLAKHRVYPVAAKKQKIEGVAHVRFSIDREGRLLSAAIHRSTQSVVLDDAALDVLRRANPMPPFPKALERQRLSVTLPIDFSLVTD